MVRIELVPTPEHCIETTARREFAKSRDEYLQQGGQDRELEERIELLKAFLESADFRALRSESDKHLTEGRTVRFILYFDEQGLKCDIEVDE